MPTDTGAETIGERLARLRVALATTRATIERTQANGQGFSLGGTAVTQIAIERAEAREKKLEAQIRALERRLAGTPEATVFIRTQTRIDT